MTLYLTSDVTTNYTVEVFGGATLKTGTISAGQVVSVVIPNTYFINDEGVFSNKAIRVTGDKPMVVYSYITKSAISGATLCLPTTVLGKEYYSTNFTQISNESNSNSYFTIIAVEDNTTVEIIPAAATKNGWIAGQTYTVNLNKGQIYQVLGITNINNNANDGVDLTGSKIRSIASGTGGCKRIAVFSGSGKVRISNSGCSANSSDNLYQQLYPTGAWGKKYLTVPSANRPTNFYRILKSNPATNVFLNGSLIPASSFINNSYYQFSNTTPNLIEADQPISVAQYFTTENCYSNSSPYDPDMIVLNPVEQNIDKVTLISSNLVANNPQHHMHIVMRNGGSGISSFTLDGSAVPPSSWVVHPADPNYSYLYLKNVSQGYHRIASDSGFNAIAYGYAAAESYGYSAGANVKDLYQYVTVKNQYATVNFPATCRNSPFYFSMTFPYKPTEIKWVFGGLFPDELISSPQPDDSTLVNGKKLYQYKLIKPYTIQNVGTFPIKVLAQNPTTDGCSGEQEINYDLQVYERPTVDYTFSGSGCITDSIKFTSTSNTNGRSAYLWSWDFGDGGTSSDINPAHLYNRADSFNVKFSLITDIGCISDTVSKQVVLNAMPVANFSFSDPICQTKDVTFTNGSSINKGTIVKWTWHMGDGTTKVDSSGTSLAYGYAATGTYNVTLQAESDKGCKSTVASRQVVVNPMPQPGFAMPENCLTDPFSQFTDTTKIADGSQGQFIYLWNFNDPNASGANGNTSALRNPQHKYTAVGDYNISLTVISNKGCTASVTQKFTINGRMPKSAFSLLGGNQLCSNKVLQLKNNSSVDFGSIVKLQIFWDFNTNPADTTTDMAPVAGTIYNHTYPEFFTPATKDIVVRVVAYSGETCMDVSTQTVTLQATPGIQFDPIPSVCANDPAFQITQATVSNGPVGGTFSGPGVTASGNFNPQNAGPGIATIRYTYNAVNGCANYKDQTIEVFRVPTVNAGPDRFILEGGNGQLMASATGSNLTYLWTPARNLNDPSVLQPIAAPVDDITYTLKVTSAEGCTSSDQVNIKVLKSPSVPNVFTPNGDGINDHWEIKYLDSYPGATVEIYNRYGQLVFQSKAYNKPWDGIYKGNPLPAGTYYYIINPKNGRQQMSGFVDIVR